MPPPQLPWQQRVAPWIPPGGCPYSLETKVSHVHVDLDALTHQTPATLLEVLQDSLPHKPECLQYASLSVLDLDQAFNVQNAATDTLLNAARGNSEPMLVGNMPQPVGPFKHYHLNRLRTTSHARRERIHMKDLYLCDQTVSGFGQLASRSCLPPPDMEALGVGMKVTAANKLYVFDSALVHQLMNPPSAEEAMTLDKMCRYMFRPRVGTTPIHLMACNGWLLPMCREGHWTAGLVWFPTKQLLFVDSWLAEPGSHDNHAPDVLLRLRGVLEVVSWFADNKTFDFSGWTHGSLDELSPRQPNGHDCALFTMMLARCLLHGVKLRPGCGHSDDEMDAIRNTVTLELVTNKLRSWVR